MSDSPWDSVDILADLVRLRERIRYWRRLVAKGDAVVKVEILCSPPEFMVPPYEEKTLDRSAEGRLAILDRIATDELKFEALSEDLRERIGITGEQLLDGLS